MDRYIANANTASARSATRRRGQRGSTIVEFGLVMIPTFGMLFFSFNIAWIFFGWACVQESVREGVRYGITGAGVASGASGMDNAIKTFTKQMAMGFMNNANNPTVNVQYFSSTTLSEVTGQSGATQSGNVLKVTASIQLKSLVPVWGPNGSKMGGFTAWTPTLAAASADVLETATPPPSE